MKKKTAPTDHSPYVKRFWKIVAAGVGTLVLMILLASIGAFGRLPSFEEIEDPRTNSASQILSSDGVMLGKFYEENRVHIRFDELSPDLVNALVATEDERFFKHSGIDSKALARSVFSLGRAGGGSTLTQQLAKMMFHRPPSNFILRVLQKFKEWVIAARLERQYTKREIIAMYLNQFDFLYQAVGVQSASRIYFGTTPDKLRIEQSAVLVGMAKNPSLYNPVRFPERALQRRNVVFAQMERNGYLDSQARDSLSALPLEIDFHREGHDEGLAPYFREYLRAELKKWIDKNPKPDGSKYNLYTDGLRIYSTVDSRMQKAAEDAVEKHISNLQSVYEKTEGKRSSAPFNRLSNKQIEDLLDQAEKRTPRYKNLQRLNVSKDSIRKVFDTPIPMQVFHWKGDIDTVFSPRDSIRYYKRFYQTGLISVDPQTGFIKAWVGGIDFKHFKYDHVKTGKRQVGSTFKPFVYATAIRQKHYSPCMRIPNVKVCIEKGMFGLLESWYPDNSENKYGGTVTLKQGLAQSLNTITAYLMKQIGPEAVVRLVRDLGVESEIPKQPSIALGSVDMSVYELAGAYTAFANQGVYTQPIAITRIENRDGVVLESFDPETREVMSAEDAYVITSLLKGVTESGTGGRLRYTGGGYANNVVTGFPYGFKNPIAGKTGTTQNNSDGWFIGMVPNLITAVWAGCEDRSAHFRNTYYGQGATTALPIWGMYMKSCYADEKIGVSRADFDRPSEPISIQLDCSSYSDTESTGSGTDEIDF